MKHTLPWAFALLASCASAVEGTHTVKATTVLKTETTWDGAPIAYPPGQAQVTGMIVEIAPGGETGWHMHPVPSFGMVLEGEMEVQLKNGTRRSLKAGDALAEVVGTPHNGRNTGAVPVKIVVFYTGTTGQKTTVKEDAAH